MNKCVGRMNGGIPQVPYATINQELLPFRQALPIWSMRDDIVNLINSNQVVMISGDTGSGKTTQVKCCQIKAPLRLGFNCNISFHQNCPPVWIFSLRVWCLIVAAEIYLCFGGTYSLHLQRQKWWECWGGGLYSNFTDRKMFWFLECRALRNTQKHNIKSMSTYSC